MVVPVAFGVSVHAIDGANAVEASAATAGDDHARRLGLHDRVLAPGEAVTSVDLEPRSSTDSDGVLTGEVPVDQEVVAELGVVGDVDQVVVDLGGRPLDRDLGFQRVHSRAIVCDREGAAEWAAPKRALQLGRRRMTRTRECGPSGACLTSASETGCSRWCMLRQRSQRTAPSCSGRPTRRSAGRGRSRRSGVRQTGAAVPRPFAGEGCSVVFRVAMPMPSAFSAAARSPAREAPPADRLHQFDHPTIRREP